MGNQRGAMLEDSTEKTVLLVDDDDAIRTLLTFQLKKQRCRVVEASGGEEALHRAGSLRTIDLVVTDLNMPGMGGLGLVERLRADGRAKRILVISGSCDPGALEEHIRDGEVEFLAKPFTAFEFGAAVARMLAPADGRARGAQRDSFPGWERASREAA
jgi:CheY-like chemotaxis protein